MKKIYNKYWSTIATSKDKKGNEYVSFFKFNKYPFYGCQFHPEKVLFEWILPEIGRTSLYRKISHKLSYFFVNEARKNKRQFKMPDLDIKNYNLWSRSETMSKINAKLVLKNPMKNKTKQPIITNGTGVGTMAIPLPTKIQDKAPTRKKILRVLKVSALAMKEDSFCFSPRIASHSFHYREVFSIFQRSHSFSRVVQHSIGNSRQSIQSELLFVYH